MKSFLSINDCTVNELNELLALSADLKALYKSGKRDLCLTGKVLAMLFEKASLRTRVSFQVAMHDLGGTAIRRGLVTRRDDDRRLRRPRSRAYWKRLVCTGANGDSASSFVSVTARPSIPSSRKSLSTGPTCSGSTRKASWP